MMKPCDTMKPYVFVSYKREDKEQVLEVLEKLQSKYHINIWIDTELKSKAGTEWNEEVTPILADQNCKCVLFFMSEHSMMSAPVLAELYHSQKSEKVKRNHDDKPLKIIPICLAEGLAQKGLKKWAHSFKGTDEGREKLDSSDFDVLKYVNVPTDYIEGVDKITQKHEIAIAILNEIFEGKSSITHIEADAEEIYNNLREYKDLCSSAPVDVAESTASVMSGSIVKEAVENEAEAPETDIIPDAADEITRDTTEDVATFMPEYEESDTGCMPKGSLEDESAGSQTRKKVATTTGDIRFILYGKEYTMNQSDMMLAFFAQVLNHHHDMISEIGSYKGMNCVSATDYSAKENRTEDMPTYFRTCQYFTFSNNEKLCVGTSYSLNDKLKKMAWLLAICEEDPDIFQSAQVTLPPVKSSVEKGVVTHAASSGVTFRIYGESFNLNQTDMLGVICSKMLQKHPDKLKEAADALLCIDIADYTGVPKEEKPVYFGSMNQYELGGSPVCVGGGFGMKEKLKMIAKLIQICEEDPACVKIDNYEIPDISAKHVSAKKDPINYFG